MFKMALQEKVVRLSHQQLKELAKKYEHIDSDDADAHFGHGMYDSEIMQVFNKYKRYAI